jgi:hypothetical protein
MKVAEENEVKNSTVYGSLKDISLTREKYRKGVLERFNSDSVGIMKDMFSKGSDLSRFMNMTVKFFDGKVQAKIQGAFGKTGKFKVYFGRNLDKTE